MKSGLVVLGVFFSSIALVAETVAADGVSERSQYVEELQQLVKDGEERVRADKSSPSVVGTQPKLPVVEAKSSEEIITGLLDEVERLKAKEIVEKRNAVNLESPRRSMHVGSKTVYPYIEGKLYEVHCGVDKVTDIALEPGEKLTNTPMAGDTVRWKVGLLTSGGKAETSHIVVKPLESELETNLIVTTDRRIYHIRLLSGDWYMPSVSWNYPVEEKTVEEVLKETRKLEEEEPIGLPPERLRFDYEVEGETGFKPEIVFDDGEKTYLRMAENIKGDDAPAFFVLSESDEPMLVNYRVKGRFYIVDRLFERGELRVGEEKVVRVFSPTYKRSFFERIF